jgi:2-hydroxychromene-2-carboxylate isomerase
VTARRPVRPRIYFNLRSPYSWLALHDLTTRHTDVADAVEWRPFWEPAPDSDEVLRKAGGQFLYTPMSREKHLYILSDVRRLATARGLGISWPIDRAPRWEISHLAYLVAERVGLGQEFAVAVSRARWERGLDISDPDVIGGIGTTLGLDPVALAAAGRDPDLVAAGTAALMNLYRDGVFGVPFFVHGRDKFWGIDRLDDFVRGVRAAEIPPPKPPVAATVLAAASDDGHAGGCG